MKLESVFEKFTLKKITRKGFLKLCGIGIGSMALKSALFKIAFGKDEFSAGRQVKRVKSLHDLAVVKGEDPYVNTIKAVEALGGMEKFVKKNSTVLIKPNIGWDRSPEQAGNTNPYVVAALVEMCFKAGAKRGSEKSSE